MSLTNACKRCFSRKQKCDRMLPSCSQCVKFKARCEPRLTAHVETEDTSYAEATASSLGTIDYIKRRIRYLEAQQAGQDQQLPTPNDSHVNDVSSKGRSREVNSIVATVTSSDKPESRTINDALDDIGYLSLAAVGDQTAHVMIISGEMAYANFVLAALGVRSDNPALATQSPSSTGQLSSQNWQNSTTDSDHRLLWEDAIKCIGKFIEYSNLLHPYISKEKCLNAYQTVRAAEQDNTIGQLAASSPELVIIGYGSVALGMLMTDPRTAINTVVPQIMKRVNEVIPQLITRASNVVVIECLTLLILLCLHIPTAGSAWYLIGLAMSKAVALGLHRQTVRPLTLELASNKEKLFWTLYKLDRLISFAMNRPFTVDDAHIVINLPEMPHPSTMTDRGTLTQALEVWSIYHMQMLSDWRNDPDADAEFYLSTFEYWRNTYQGITERVMKENGSGTSYEKQAFESHLRNFESQLCLRAVTQLAVIILTRESNAHARERLRELVLADVPRYVTHSRETIEKFGFIAGFLKGYDALSGGVIFIEAIYGSALDKRRAQQKQATGSGGHDQSYGVRAADTKIIASCAEILNHVGERFISMRAMKDVLWAFMTAAEAQLFAGEPIDGDQEPGNSENFQSDAFRDLVSTIEASEVEIPTHLCQIMSCCLRCDPELLKC